MSGSQPLVGWIQPPGYNHYDSNRAGSQLVGICASGGNNLWQCRSLLSEPFILSQRNGRHGRKCLPSAGRGVLAHRPEHSRSGSTGTLDTRRRGLARACRYRRTANDTRDARFVRVISSGPVPSGLSPTDRPRDDPNFGRTCANEPWRVEHTSLGARLAGADEKTPRSHRCSAFVVTALTTTTSRAAMMTYL
jgi:hypothetical protein